MATRRTLSLVFVITVLASACSSPEPEAAPDLSWPDSATTLTGLPAELASEAVGVQETNAEDDGSESRGSAVQRVSLDTEVIEVELDDVFDDVHIVNLPVPVGWQRSDFSGATFDPPTDSGFGFFTKLSVDNGCNGICEPQDWIANLTGPDGPITVQRLNAIDGSIVRDEPIGATGWLMVSDDSFDDGYDIDVYRWNDSADFFFQCSATTGMRGEQILQDLLEICLTAEPNWLG